MATGKNVWLSGTCSFSNAILEMGICSTIGDSLFVLFTVSHKQIISKVNGHVEHTHHDFLQTIQRLSWPWLFPLRLCLLWGVCAITWRGGQQRCALYLLLVSFHLSWAIKPTCILIIWSIDTHSLCFVALKIDLLSLWDGFVLYGFVMVPKRQPAHVGGLTL